jgi:hypothetical protein
MPFAVMCHDSEIKPPMISRDQVVCLTVCLKESTVFQFQSTCEDLSVMMPFVVTAMLESNLLTEILHAELVASDIDAVEVVHGPAEVVLITTPPMLPISMISVINLSSQWTRNPNKWEGSGHRCSRRARKVL